MRIPSLRPDSGRTDRSSRTWQRSFVAVCALGIVLFLAGESAAGRQFTVSKKAGDYRVDVTIDRNPPVMGDNIVTIRVKDSAGAMITDARVVVNYYMPPMQGMPPMNYTTAAALRGTEYAMTMKIIMTGPWHIVVSVNRGGKSASMRFTIDVR